MSAPTARPPQAAAQRAGAPSATDSPQPVPAGGGLVGFAGARQVPPAVNEPVRGYAPGSPERASLKSRLASMAGERAEIPLVIGGKGACACQSGERLP